MLLECWKYASYNFLLNSLSQINDILVFFLDNFLSLFQKQIQCPLDITTLDIAAALPIATSTPMELGALSVLFPAE